MNLADLRYLVALTSKRSFSRAADMCAVSQPTLSAAVAKIESELGLKLFERGSSSVTPTPIGRKVVEQAQVALREVERVRQIAQGGRDPLRGPLQLGAIHTVAPYLLPRMIPLLKQLAPEMTLVIEENMTVHLRDMMMEGELDAAIIALPFEAPGVVDIPLYEEPFLIIVPKGHPWEKRKAMRPEEIADEPVLLLKAGNCFRDQVLDACPQVSAPESDFHMGQSLATLRCMVSSGLGVSVLPASALQSPYQSDLISTIPFADPKPSRRIALAYRKGFVRMPAIRTLVDAVRALDSPVFRTVRRTKSDASDRVEREDAR
jgi:LysR family hydrogen peroxide-inducible transcriptional activator